MNDDNDLRALYLASQKDVHAPEQLKERTLELLDDNDAAFASARLSPLRPLGSNVSWGLGVSRSMALPRAWRLRLWVWGRAGNDAYE